MVDIINAHKHGDELVLGIRPEHMQVHTEQPQGVSVPSEVYVSEPLGAEVIVNAQMGSQVIKVRTPSGTKVDVGQRIWLTFAEKFAHVFDKETEQSLRITMASS